MAISLPDARQLSDEVLQSLRLRALRGCELGYSEIEVAELLGLSRETVSRWWTAYVDHGLEALPGDRTGRPVGSGRTLNDGQAARLRTILNEKSPEEVGIASPLWTRRAVAELIRKEYGIDMPVRTVGEYLERWGYTAKVPRPSCQGSGPRGGPPLAGGHLSGDRSRGPPVRMRRSTGATRPAPAADQLTATGVTPARGGRRGSRCPIPTSA